MTTTHRRHQVEPEGRTHFFLWAPSLSGPSCSTFPRHPSAQLCWQRYYLLLLCFITCWICYYTATYPHTRTIRIHAHRIVSYRIPRYSLLLQAPHHLRISFNLTSLYEKRRVWSRRVAFAIFFAHLIISFPTHHISSLLTRPNLCPRSGSEGGKSDDMSACRITHCPADI